MRKVLVTLTAVVVVILLVSYGLWTSKRRVGHYLTDLRIQVVVNDGQPGDRGNLLGIQPELFPSDYSSVKRLHRKLAAYLQQAREHGLITDKTIVVLPEHIGTWLFAVDEKSQFYQAATIDEAMNWLAFSNPLLFTDAVLHARGKSRIDDARLRMKARSMAENYQSLFGGLAREFGVTLVAGSIVLPSPKVQADKLIIGTGALYNSSLVFGPNGLPLGQPQRQLFPSWYQQGYIRPGKDAPLYVIDTPAGRLATLIGSDSWYPDNYLRLNAEGAELIAVPAFVAGRSSWTQPWRRDKHQGLDLGPKPLTQGEAWRRLTLAPISTAKAGISVFMRGQFWDQGSTGHSFATRGGQSVAEQSISASPKGAKPGHGARLINLWL
ncbi:MULTISPECIES: carbon-nitrogen hydrolase family protein [unclassified Pseudomonas]|uniref:carbon-nitrogen hydrolase family protein n=1 Tax=unclassified Pseudomonas TaxID=196821 RepID=UPI000D34B4EC|nr:MULTISPECIES: carbon-nitrogen hydrolase family protein [unclassified Pseudomonas]RAU47359.1 carbon-nitrogen hydrolase family protein [Pseudomonas sp. RIT 409]RAU51966.1 carbon-nitrogen hydrolase family protein [Pseudomonas sp. RIT 412]